MKKNHNILVINCGSSSLKYQLFNISKNGKNSNVILKGNAEKIGDKSSFLKHSYNGKKSEIKEYFSNHNAVLNKIIKLLGDIKIDAVGHRVVHGGESFASSVKITPKVLKTIEKNIPLAPLHNPANISGIKSAQKAFPKAVQVAVFDTAFHQTMPKENYLYATPYEWYKKHKVRKYGFHGTSHLYISKRVASLLNKKENKLNMITLHLGSGASISAIKNGVSIDNSMGMTPLAGVIMGTRSGDIDAGIVQYLVNEKKIKLNDIFNLLNKKSGLLGVAGKNDNRDILEGIKQGNEQYKLAFDMEISRIKKYIGSYFAILDGKIDAIAFAGGVGERSSTHRKSIIDGLQTFGIELDKKKNNKIVNSNIEEGLISSKKSKVKVFVIPTDEERVIAEDTYAILQNFYNPNHLKMKYNF